MMYYLNMHLNIYVVELDPSLEFIEGVFIVCPMGDGDGSKKTATTTGMQNPSLGISSNTFSRDLLQSFMGSSTSSSGYDLVKEDDEIELNLGLSLGGRFGVDKSSNKLGRSSSIASCLPVVRDDNDAMAPPPVAYSGLMRTSSLPVETEDEWRKRKEMQSLRRMAAKRRRFEKQRSLKGDHKEGEGSGIGGGGRLSLEDRKEIEVDLRGKSEIGKRLNSSIGLEFGLCVPPLAKGKGTYVGSSGGMQGLGQLAMQGSMEAKGVSSLDLESKALQGSAGDPSVQSLQEETNQGVGLSGTRKTGNANRPLGSETESQCKRPDTSRTRGKEAGTSSMDDMPSVFTKGDGPNGRRVDGILYKYGKGEEVRIMCVCHGSFHSPAEFVRHAGGSDVDHPLKHIVINPNSSPLL